MGTLITWETIYIRGCIEADCVKKLSFSQILNEHAKAQVVCELSKEIFEQYNKKLLFGEIQVFTRGKENPIFAGIINQVDIEQSGKTIILILTLVSGTYLLDKKKRCKSFGKKQGYKKVMEAVLENQGKAIYTVNDRAIDYPLIQYEETDWEFLKRIASNLETSVIPDINSASKPRYYIGIRNGKDQWHYNSDHYTEISRKNGQLVSIYEIETFDDWKIGDKIIFNENSFRICEKEGNIQNGVLMFRYIISSDNICMIGEMK